MSSIFALLNHNQIKLPNTIIEDQAKKGHEQDSNSSKTYINNKIFLSCLSFNKLITGNELDKKSEQPLKYNNKVLICNGEIYNSKQLLKLMNLKATTTYDCEVIIHLYEKYGMEYTLKCLDGVYAFILIDNDINKVFIGRDKFGERPLFYLSNKSGLEKQDSILGFASTMKQLYFFTQNTQNTQNTQLSNTVITPSNSSNNISTQQPFYGSINNLINIIALIIIIGLIIALYILQKNNVPIKK